MRNVFLISLAIFLVSAAMSPCSAAGPGSIVGWGDNTEGQINCPSGTNYVDMAGGGDHSLALKSDGSLIGWGASGSGQADCPSGTDYVAIDAGGFELSTGTLSGFIKQGKTRVLVGVVKVEKKVYDEIVGWEWKGRFGDLDRY